MNAFRHKSNIAFIGMTACGKSTIGARVAKELSMSFVDTDAVIEQTFGKPLWKLLEEDGIETFIAKESQVLCSLDCTNSCISTGGSAVYSEKAMEALKQHAHLVFIELSYPNIHKRLADLDVSSRGVVMGAGQTLANVYEERQPLYRKYADSTIQADDASVDQLVAQVVRLFAYQD